MRAEVASRIPRRSPAGAATAPASAAPERARWRRLGRAAAVGGALALLLVPAVADAALGLSLAVSPSFGTILAGPSGRQFILGTDGTISGADAADHVSGAWEGRLTVTDDAAPSSIVILVDNVLTLGGVSFVEATCSYDADAPQRCDGAGMTATSQASAALDLGLEITTAQAHSGGDAATVTMDVTVTYL